MDGGVTINRPPRDGHMAFVRTPDNISIELLQDGAPLRRPSPGLRCRIPAPGDEAAARFLELTGAARADRAGADGGGGRRRAGGGRDTGRGARIAALRDAVGRSRCARRSPKCARRRRGRSTSISSATRCLSPPDESEWRNVARALLCGGRRRRPGAAAAAPAVRRRDVRGGRGGAARDRELPFRAAGAGAARAGARRGAKVFGNATTPTKRTGSPAHGCDAIIAQGGEAGGHAGWFLDTHRPIGTLALVRGWSRGRPAGDRGGRDRRRCRDRRGVPARRRRRCRSAPPISPRPKA
jgi:hypothetical protein